jgi:hypothetical protein
MHPGQREILEKEFAGLQRVLVDEHIALELIDQLTILAFQGQSPAVVRFGVVNLGKRSRGHRFGIDTTEIMRKRLA